MQTNQQCSFILRLWREEQSTARVWRASVEIPGSGQRIGFASLEQLFAFLLNYIEINDVHQLLEGEDGLEIADISPA
ncbi:MAG: hypothetical protein ACM3H7_08935 [Acidobacteriaceae bacterium]